MSEVNGPFTQDATQRWRPLLDSRADDGLLIAYDGTGPAPLVTLDSPDGQIELHGYDEIRAARRALHCGERLARSFDPPPSLAHWRKMHG